MPAIGAADSQREWVSEVWTGHVAEEFPQVVRRAFAVGAGKKG